MMKYGILADSFEGAGAKYLTEVEVNKFRSNQHEFQGVSAFRTLLGTPAEKFTFPATFYWLDDDEDSEPVKLTASCTWSDVRRNNPNRTPEYHLYYPASSEPVVHRASAGDLLVIAKTTEQELLVIVCQQSTTIEQQLLWLFGLHPGENQLDWKTIGADDSVQLGFAARSVLDDLGIVPTEPEPDAFDKLVGLYGLAFPPTAEFSQFARDTIAGIDPVEFPDEALVAWMDHEEALFRHMEREIVTDRLKTGFEIDGVVDVDGFTEFSLGFQNRRKSRAGWAFGHHVEAVLQAHNVLYTREAKTEGQKKPDFLFPGQTSYHDPAFDTAQLMMLGVKTSCKERWRQVLSEAHKISEKHLLTLQPGISVPQTDEMRAEKLQLVIPRPIFDSYQDSQRAWLMDVNAFIGLVKSRQ